MKYRAHIPPTSNLGSVSLFCRDSLWASYRADALVDYNIMRKHEGLPPLKRMPAGTTYTKVEG